jgi:hypothetical protein
MGGRSPGGIRKARGDLNFDPFQLVDGRLRDAAPGMTLSQCWLFRAPQGRAVGPGAGG